MVGINVYDQTPKPTQQVYLNENLTKQPSIGYIFTSTDAHQFFGKLFQDNTGWIFGFFITKPDGTVRWESDGMLQNSWPMALQAAIEYAKMVFGFHDIVITNIAGKEYHE